MFMLHSEGLIEMSFLGDKPALHIELIVGQELARYCYGNVMRWDMCLIC